MASLDFAQSLTTFNLVRCIFSVNWSTAMLLGAHTSTCLIGEKGENDRNTHRNTDNIRRAVYLSKMIDN